MASSAPAAAPSSEKAQPLTLQTFWFAAAKTLAFAVSVIFPFLLVRLVSQTEFGLYKQAFLVTTTAIRILSMGFGLSAFFFFPRFKGNEGAAAANIIAFNFVMGALAWMALAAKPDLLARLFNGDGLTGYAPLLGCVIFLWVFSSFLEIAPAAMQDTAASVILIVAVQFSRTAFMLAATLIAPSVESLLWASLLQGLCQSICLLVYLHRRCPGFMRKFSTNVFRTQMRYVLPMTGAYFIGVIGTDISQYLVAAEVNPAVFAVYAAGTFSLPLMGVLHESVGMVMVPVLSKLHQEGNTREIIALQAGAMRKMAAITLPVWLCLVVVSEQFVVLLYTTAYRESAAIFAINMTLLPLMVLIYDPLARVYSETQRYLVVVRAALVATAIVAMPAVLKVAGITGAICMVILVAAIERVTVVYKLARLLGITTEHGKLFKDIPKIGLCSVAAAIPAWACRSATADYHPAVVVGLCSCVYGIVYVSAAIAMDIPQQNERAALVRHARKFLPIRAARPCAAVTGGVPDTDPDMRAKL